MPFSELKIDRSFVMQMMNNNAASHRQIVVDLARKLD